MEISYQQGQLGWGLPWRSKGPDDEELIYFIASCMWDKWLVAYAKTFESPVIAGGLWGSQVREAENPLIRILPC